MERESVPATSGVKNLLWAPNPEDNFATDLRYLRGFVQLQDMIDGAIIRLQTDGNVSQPSIQLQQFPYPCHRADIFQLYVGTYFFPIVMTLAWLVCVASSIHSIVYDKEKALEETLKIMGLRSGVNWFAWFINTFVGMLIVCFFLVLVLKLGNLMPYSDPVFLFVYLALFSFSVVMFCYMISSFFTRTTVASLTGVLAYLISYLPFIVITSVSVKLGIWQQRLVYLSATTAFGFGAQLIARYEQSQVGLQWNNVDDEIGWKITFDWCCYMMLIDGFIYGIIGWYVRNVYPGHYGIPQPWYFPLSCNYWRCCCFGNKETSEKYKSGEAEQTCPGEVEPGHLPIGISIHQLSKKFKKNKRKTVAVDNLSVNIFKGQITAFLGQNGAGKTTTVNMLTGFIEPSSGTAYVEGFNIKKDVFQLRQELGICPQHDVLYDFMTVREHMELFVNLKSRGLSRKQKKEEVERMLEMSGLKPSANVQASKLSGGQRRRLCVVNAFIGGSKVIILDEPTSGIDPSARRAIWEMIIKHRTGRTILLSTHHLYEADVLGDRIVMIHQGKLVCAGSPLYMKTHYGSGYHLVLSKQQNVTMEEDDGKTVTILRNTADSSKILRFVREHVPDAHITEDIGTELSIVLPNDQQQVAHFQGLFANLDANLDELGISSYGLSDTSLEEVFLKLAYNSMRNIPIEDKTMKELKWKGVSDKDSDKDSGLSTPRDSTLVNPNKKLYESEEVRVEPSVYTIPATTRKEGCGLVFAQFAALFMKRLHHHKRDLKSYFSQIILPIVFVCMAMGFAKIAPRNDNLPSLALGPNIYGPDTNMFFRMDSPTEQNMDYVQTMLNSPGVGTACMEDSDLIDKCSGSQDSTFVTDTIPRDKLSMYENPQACTCSQGRYDCPEGAGGMPPPRMVTMARNNMYNITGSQLDTSDYLLNTFTDSNFLQNRYGGWTFGATENLTSLTSVWFNNKGWHALPSYYNALSNMVLRAGIGKDASKYGVTVYNHPLNMTQEQLSEQFFLQGVAETGISLTILCAFCFVPAGYAIYLIQERIMREKRLQIICDVGLGTYWFTALVWDMLAYLFTVALALVVTAIFMLPAYTARENMGALVVSLIMFGWATIPLTYLLSRLFKRVASGYMMLFTINLLIGLTTTVCTFLLSLFNNGDNLSEAYRILSQVFLIFPQFCLGDALIQLSRNQFLAEINERFHIDSYKSPFGREMLLWHFVALAIEGFCFLVLHFIIETRPCKSSKHSSEAPAAVQAGLTGMDRKRMDPDYNEEEDVSLERQRVMTGGASTDPLVLYNLKKVYKKGSHKITAVDNLTVGIQTGECFGLLGVNGAGKTTAFNMMTGEVLPSVGAALLNNKIISTNLPRMNQQIGYCPQVDALDPNLSVKEILYCYGKLKGISVDDLDRMLPCIVKKLALEPYVRQTIKRLSGGTKRKVSTAVALLGDPDILLLDEPTTGMDPQTRRLVWNTISSVIRENRSVVLTSHSMEECEALCTRLAIMVNGRFQCLGNKQTLKHKYGNGYTVTIKAAQNVGDLSSIVHYMLSTFRGAVVKDHHLNMLDFEIPHSSARLADIFGSLNESRDHLNIQDYSVSQTSLEQVFVNFARRQNDGLSPEPTSDSAGVEPSAPDAEEGYPKHKGYFNPAFDSYSPGPSVTTLTL